MKRYFNYFSLILSMTLFFCCTNKDNNKSLTIEKVVFNKLDSFRRPVVISSEPINKRRNPLYISSVPVYKKGEVMLLVFQNIKGFMKGNDSLNKMELDTEFKGYDGLILFSQEKMLGERGHVNLPDNIAPEHYTTFNIPVYAKPGKYSYKIRISDLVSKKDIVIKGKFRVK